jgi:hypothetical protein
MGLRQATGYPYESFVFLLEELTRPGPGSRALPGVSTVTREAENRSSAS